jgi:hypothetical protein
MSKMCEGFLFEVFELILTDQDVSRTAGRLRGAFSDTSLILPTNISDELLNCIGSMRGDMSRVPVAELQEAVAGAPCDD